MIIIIIINYILKMYYKLYFENVCNICMHSFISFDRE